MAKIIGIECLYNSEVYEIPYTEKPLVEPLDDVIFKDEEGKEEHGVVKYIKEGQLENSNFLKDSKILRKATANDLQKVDSHLEQSENALNTCKVLINSYALDMNVFRSRYSFDGNKIHFTFTAEERVDFRELVKDLAKALKKQIHLRQIGPRDKAKLIGGYGKCGRALCCSSFLDKLESINMEMVREQGLESKGSSKLSGSCGKLLCCLKYEVTAYKDLRKNLPSVGYFVRIKSSVAGAPETDVKIIGLDILNQKIKVYCGVDEIMFFKASDIDKVIKKS